MPAPITNVNHLAAFNSIVEALNNLEALGGNDPGSLTAEVAAIAQMVDNLRASLEARSIAEVVGQNTNFADLTASVNAIRLICAPQVSVTVDNYIQGIYPSVDDTFDGTVPEEPFEELPPEYTPPVIQNRKCWAATEITDNLIAAFTSWNNAYLDEIANVAFSGLVGLWIAGIAAVAGEAGLIALTAGAAAGYITGIAQYVYKNAGLLDFASVITALENNREDLICALLNATSVAEARSDFVSITANPGGLDSVNNTFLAIVIDNNLAAYLFADDKQSDDLYLYALENGFSGCVSCVDDCDFRLVSGTEISNNGVTLEAQSVLLSGNYYVQVYLNANSDLSVCTPTFTVSNFSFTGGVFTPTSPAGVRIADDVMGSGGVGNLYHSNVLPVSPVTGARVLVFKSTTDFTVQFNYVQE